MKNLRYTDNANDLWRYDIEKDTMTIACDGNVQSLLLNDEKYFKIVNNTILIENFNDVLTNEHLNFFIRCLKSKCSLIGIKFAHIQENNSNILKFKNNADFAFFCLKFSEYIE
jgi:hypothetical protein